MLSAQVKPTRPSSPRPAGVTSLGRQQHAGFLGVSIAIIGITAVAALLLTVLPGTLAAGIGAIVAVPALLVWLARQPVRGVYLLLTASVVLDEYSFGNFSDDIGRFVPFFQDISTWTHVKGISFSLAELCMLLVFLIWFLRGIGARTLRFEKGTLMRPMSLYVVMVLVGEVVGLATGGDFRTSLWEIRSQIYLFVAYVLACNLVKTRKQLNVLMWIIVVGAGLKGFQGTWRWLITLHGNIHSTNEIFPHEQSFYFGALFVLTPILFLYGGSRRMKRAVLYMLPFVVLATLANQRRAATIALLINLIAVIAVTIIAHPVRRRTAAKILITLAIILPPYVLMFGHSSNAFAGPAKAVMSAFNPDPRDAGSDLYRRHEDKDIMFTMNKSPIVGYGFGKVMDNPYNLPDISNLYVWYLILPHDSILWVWMRLGTIGYLLLWYIIGTAIIQATRLLRQLDDPYLKGLALFVILMIVQQIIIGYLDLSWTNYRTMITTGVLLAIIGTLSSFACPQEQSAAPFGRRGRAKRVAIPQSLAVVDGRLIKQSARGRA